MTACSYEVLGPIRKVRTVVVTPTPNIYGLLSRFSESVIHRHDLNIILDMLRFKCVVPFGTVKNTQRCHSLQNWS